MFRFAALRPSPVARNLVSRTFQPILSSRSPLSSAALPSNTTTLRVLGLPNNITESLLRESVGNAVDARKVEIEPGCAIHVLNEAEAQHAKTVLAAASLDAISLDGCNVISTAMPAVYLDNIPASMTSESISELFSKHDLNVVHVTGGSALQIHMADEDSALRAARMMSLLSFDGISPNTRVSRLHDGSYDVHINNLPVGGEATDKAVKTMRDALLATFPDAKLQQTAEPQQTVQLRYADPATESALNSRSEEVAAKLTDLSFVTGVTSLSTLRPAVHIKHARRYKNAQLVKLLEQQPGCKQILQRRRSPDAAADQVVALFDTTEQAMAANTALRGKKDMQDAKGRPTTQPLICKYKGAALTSVHVSGLPQGSTAEHVTDFFHSNGYHVAEAILLASGSAARVVLHSPQDAELAAQTLPLIRKNAKDQKAKHFSAILSDKKSVSADVKVEKEDGFSVGLTVHLAHDAPADASAQVLQALGGLTSAQYDGKPEEVSNHSNMSAFVGFKSMEHAKAAQHHFTTTNTENSMTSKISLIPSYSVHVNGLGPETPAKAIEAALSKDGLVHPLGVNRSGLLKFKRHLEVVPAMKKLKAVTVKDSEGNEQALSVKRYRHEVSSGASEYDLYDTAEAQTDEGFERFALDSVLKDYMGADPGLRMQIAKNYFERAMYDARHMQDITYVLQNDAPEHIQAEARKLLATVKKGKVGDIPKNTRQRLFELFLQRDDMQRFSADFREMSALMGGQSGEGDPFSWSEFQLTGTEDMERLLDAFDELEGDKGTKMTVQEQKAIQRKLKKQEREYRERYGDEAWEIVQTEREASLAERALLADQGILGDGSSADGFGATANPADDEMNARGIDFDPVTRTDRDGRVWSTAILNTDVVQKTMPGGRVNTHRCLVVIGNLRGSAGYGMGKAGTPADAVTNAFANAYRNLHHIDLFDNYGLAHNLHGKHNSCQVYIRATPKSRLMVASPFARAILLRFGISSASVKIVGRRDPYAQCKAIFNAIGKHENIDEIAKDRGRRFVSLRWMHDQGL